MGPPNQETPTIFPPERTASSAWSSVWCPANPCFGLDFQASAEIHARLRAARDSGAGILLVSEDLDELLALASRLVVLSHGQVALACATAQADIAAIGRAMAGDSALEQAA